LVTNANSISRCPHREKCVAASRTLGLFRNLEARSDFLAGDASDPKRKKSTEAPFVIDVPDVFTQAFVIEKDSKRFPKSGGWGYALFNYDAKTDAFSADAASKSDCGHACHLKVAKKDFIFHPYQ
jgi:hypothetical protein